MDKEQTKVADFRQFDLAEPLQKALKDVGYEIPTPIQEKVIPLILEGRDVVGQAQTGTGKTAAFALPLLSKIDLKKLTPQVLVLTPTRELAIQVAEAFQKYAAHLKGFHVLPIYGGAEYGGQLRGLRRGAHVVVGTPGRVMDHMERETLSLDTLTCLVLDEADEMLRMGFREDVEWILDRTPDERQISLFSATIPPAIRAISKKYLRDPQEVTIKGRTTTVEATRQRYWVVSGVHKLDALTRILEAETYDGILIFVRTRIATLELAEKLSARGFAAAPLNGDIAQNQRERTIDQLRTGKLNILVATDVAARGLDVDRISHVINYDIPYDTESYIHRIGRTGRAGRNGEAILFVAPKERRILSVIERATRQSIAMMELPAVELINDRRVNLFKQKISDTLGANDLAFFRTLIEQYSQEHNVEHVEVAAALAKMFQGETPLLLPPSVSRPAPMERAFPDRSAYSDRAPRHVPGFKARDQEELDVEEGMERYRIEIGHRHNVLPGNIVGAIAGESGLHSRYIGRIKIYQDFSTVELPEGMPDHVLEILRRAWISGRQLNISRVDVASSSSVDHADGEAVAEEKPAARGETWNGVERTERPARGPRPERPGRDRGAPAEPVMGRPRTGRPPRFEREEASRPRPSSTEGAEGRGSRPERAGAPRTADRPRSADERPSRDTRSAPEKAGWKSGPPLREEAGARGRSDRKPARSGEAPPRRPRPPAKE